MPMNYRKQPRTDGLGTPQPFFSYTALVRVEVSPRTSHARYSPHPTLKITPRVNWQQR